MNRFIFFLFNTQWKLRDSSSVWQRRQWQPTSVLLPGESYGWRSLVGCSPWGREESDMTERLHFHFSLSCLGEGNGNRLQCSCLENHMDGGAWWAAVYGVTQSRTQLKRLSSSNSSSSSVWMRAELLKISVWWSENFFFRHGVSSYKSKADIGSLVLKFPVLIISSLSVILLQWWVVGDRHRKLLLHFCWLVYFQRVPG